MSQNNNIVAFAQITNQLTRAYREATQQESPAEWHLMAEEDQKHVIDRVRFYLTEPDITVSSLHDAWAYAQFNAGWVYGLAFNEDKKTHPMLIIYADLPLMRRVEDTLFMQTVQTLSRLM